MAGKAIVITSGKGGVGKTTTTANLGTGLGPLGRRVVPDRRRHRPAQPRRGDGPRKPHRLRLWSTSSKASASCTTPSIKDKRVENLFLLPAAQTREKDAITPKQMKEICDAS